MNFSVIFFMSGLVKPKKNVHNAVLVAGVVELVDAPDSKSGSERSGGSIPPPGTNE